MMIYVFGDSITYGCWDKEGGWVTRLRKFLDDKFPQKHFIYNLGIPIDEDTFHLLSRLENELEARTSAGFEKENIVIFAIGSNDSQFIHSKNSLRTHLEKFKENIQKLISLAQKFSSKIIFVGLTPVDESKTTPIPWNTDKSYRNEYIKKYNEIIKSVCEENSILFINIFEEWIVVDYKKWLSDGVHPNSEGHRKIFEAVKNWLKNIIYISA